MDVSIEKLKKLHHNGKLCLFVGAGISKSCGLPDWNELSVRVIEETWPDRGEIGDVFRRLERSERSKYSPLDAMRMARNELKAQFNSTVFKCLYNETPTLSRLVKSIVSLKSVSRVICTNYDDVMEEGYSSRGIDCRSLVPNDNLPLDSEQLLIFHPHGYLPRGIQSRDYLKDPIIISEDDYHDLYATPYSWANMIQLNLLVSFDLLFVGCSLRDPNLRRLLDVSRRIRPNEHFALMRNPDFQLTVDTNRPRWWAEFISFQKHVETENLSGRGVTPIWYEDHSQLPELLLRIA
jgi:hypothetical protein